MRGEPDKTGSLCSDLATAAAARLTCASGGGNPWPRLSFLINGSRVEAETLVPLVTSIITSSIFENILNII